MLKISKYKKVYLPRQMRDPFKRVTYVENYIPDPHPENRFKKPK